MLAAISYDLMFLERAVMGGFGRVASEVNQGQAMSPTWRWSSQS